MKSGIRFFSILLLILFSKSALADYCCPRWYGGINPYGGFDIKGQLTQGKDDWRPMFPKYYFAGNVYAGFKFHENFGFELGYEQTERRTITHTLNHIHRFYTVDLIDFSFSRSMKFQTAHFMASYYIQLIHCFDLMLSYGMGFIRSKTRAVMHAGLKTDVEQALINLRLPTRGISKARIGLVWHLAPFYGVRGFIGYDNTSQISIRNVERVFARHNITNHTFRDTLSINFGFFMSVFPQHLW